MSIANTETVSLNRPRRGRLAIKLVGGVLAALACVVAAGAIHEAIAGLTDASRYPMPGRLVDVGDHSLHLDCRGNGGPTVVLDAGLGASSVDWTLVQPELATTTRVCSYDRAGMGWSEMGTGTRSPGRLAEELHALLHNAGVPGPYVLVAHSLAGKNARMFALAHPEEVAGMVLIDARSERVDEQTSAEEADGFASALRTRGAMFSLARRTGLARLFGGSLVDERLVPQAVATELALLQTQPAAIETTINEGLARSADDAALSGSTLGSMPLVVIAAGDNMEKAPWAEAQRALARLSSNGRLVVAEGSGHAVQLQQPALVIEGVRQVLTEIAGR